MLPYIKQNTKCSIQHCHTILSTSMRMIKGAGMAHVMRDCAGSDSIPGLGVKCGLSFLLVLVPCSEMFFSGYSGFPPPQKPTFPNSNSMWNPRATGLPVVGLLSVTLVQQNLYHQKGRIKCWHDTFI